MGGLSIWHWLIVLVIVILVFGTKKLGSVGKDLGSAVRGFKEGMKEGADAGAASRTVGIFMKFVVPLPLRIWHWLNALGMVTLALTGIQIRYVGVIDVVSFHTAVVVHNYTGFAVIANFFLWLLFHLFTDQADIDRLVEGLHDVRRVMGV